MIQLTVPADKPTIAYAAGQLASYFGRMLPETCTTVQVRTGQEDIFTTPSPDTGAASPAGPSAGLTISLSAMIPEEEEDWYRIHITRRGGSITAGNSRSVLLAVYRYLHELGCRFLAPGAACEVVPVISMDMMYLTREQKASFRHRGACIEGANSLENVLDFVDWLPKIGCNSFFLQFKVPYTFFARWYHHENNTCLSAESYELSDAAVHMQAVEKAMELRGLMLHKFGHGWTGESLGFPSVSWHPDDTPLSEEQKAMTALVKGARKLNRGIPINTNLCYSNPKARDKFVSLIVDYASSHPEVTYLHIWLADECNNVCECDACRQTTISDQYVELLNQVDEILTEKNIDTKLVFLLYQELLWPPTGTKLKNPDRFLLMFAPISRTFESSYQLDTAGSPSQEAGHPSPGIPVYQRNHITMPTSLTQNIAFLKSWQEIFDGDSFIFDYHLDRAHYGDLGYIHIANIISQDVKKLHRIGVNGLISCQELRAGLPNSLPGYVMGRTLMDENASFEETVKEYCQAAYGSDYGQVLDYLQKLSDLSSCDYFNGKTARTDPDIAGRMRDILKCVTDFGQVIASHCRDGRWDTPFWRLLDYHGEYVLHLAKAMMELAAGSEEQALADWKQFGDFISRNEMSYQDALDVYRVLEVSSKFTGFGKIPRTRSTGEIR